MHSIALSLPAGLRPSWSSKLLKLIHKWRRRFVTRRHLLSLDRRALEDVGIDPASARREATKWFWQA